MAASKFATAIQRNHNKIVVVLVYTVLELILISLLLVDSVLSYLTYKFASYFALKTPCLFCSRLEKNRDSYRELLCEDHAVEVSLLRYCSSHGKLADAVDLCDDCSSSSAAAAAPAPAMFPSEIDCSCCQVSLESGFYCLDLKKEGFRDGDELEEVSPPSALDAVEVDDSLREMVDRCRGGGYKERSVFVELIDSLTLDVPNPGVVGHLDPFVDLIAAFDGDGSGESEESVPADDEGILCKQHVREIEESVPAAAADDDDGILCKQHVREIEESVPAAADDDDDGILFKQHVDKNEESVPADDDGILCKQHVREIEESVPADDDDDGILYKQHVDENEESVPADDEGILCKQHVHEIEESVPADEGIFRKQLIDENEESVPADDEGILCKQHVDENEESQTKDDNVGMQAVVQEEMLDSEDADGTDSDANYEVTIGSEICVIDQFDQPKLPQLPTLDGIPTGKHDEAEDKCHFTTSDTGTSSMQFLEPRFLLALVWSLIMMNKTVDSQNNDKNGGQKTSEASLETGRCDHENGGDHENQTPNSPSASCSTKIIDDEDACEISVSNDNWCSSQIGDDPLLQKQLSLSSGDINNSIGVHDESGVAKQVSDQDDNSGAPIRNEVLNNQPHPDQEENCVSLAKPLRKMDLEVNCQISTKCSQYNEIEEERTPETPNSLEGMYNFHKRYMLYRKESNTESVDGSITSEVEVSEISSLDQLKAALKTERKALNDLYAELEEERSASAIAANQTMAMITRLQEEKAAMHMEALHYQRMMEEQSEYDQEALHLLNDLMNKKDKEKQQLEEELEIYQKKVRFYEAKEKRMKSSVDNGENCISPAISSAEETDDLSDDPNQGEERLYDHSTSSDTTPVDGRFTTQHEQARLLNTLDESLADFEEEKMSILEELRLLEEKLFTMDDAEDFSMEELSWNHNLEENGHGLDVDKLNGNHGSERNNFSSSKSLLPLFENTLGENEDRLKDNELTDISQDTASKLVPEQKNHAVTKEMNHIYQRLRALEVEKEIFKHSMRSMKNGSQGWIFF